MMKLNPKRPLIRETDSMERADPIVVRLHPKFIDVRLKGTKKGVIVGYDAILDLGRKMAMRKF